MSGPTPPRRPDASMTLLREVMERPLDPGYAAAAAHSRPRTRVRTAITLVLAIVAGAGFTVAVGSIRIPQRESAKVKSQLIEQIQHRTALVEEKEQANAELAAANTAAQEALLGSDGTALTDRARLLGALTGELAVTGPGMQVTLDDAGSDEEVGGDPRADTTYDEGVVLDLDLQVVVNGLWAAGAEAVAVNGQRLTALSAIRSAGDAILVDFRPLVPPYVVSAVGDTAALQSGFAEGQAGPYVQSLRDNNGIAVDISGSDELTLPAAGQIVLREAGPVDDTDDSSNDSSNDSSDDTDSSNAKDSSDDAEDGSDGTSSTVTSTPQASGSTGTQTTDSGGQT